MPLFRPNLKPCGIPGRFKKKPQKTIGFAMPFLPLFHGCRQCSPPLLAAALPALSMHSSGRYTCWPPLPHPCCGSRQASPTPPPAGGGAPRPRHAAVGARRRSVSGHVLGLRLPLRLATPRTGREFGGFARKSNTSAAASRKVLAGCPRAFSQCRRAFADVLAGVRTGRDGSRRLPAPRALDRGRPGRRGVQRHLHRGWRDDNGRGGPGRT
mmetsp:Transcript_2322/g.6184  ORF Transcript_2322/g.6184 Transcript_2322/m.6184 type:complete len:211 (-) Transcript_2322:1297-1929(-)